MSGQEEDVMNNGTLNWMYFLRILIDTLLETLV